MFFFNFILFPFVLLCFILFCCILFHGTSVYHPSFACICHVLVFYFLDISFPFFYFILCYFLLVSFPFL